MSGLRVSAILPTLDEAENIVPMIEGLFAAIEGLHEIVVVDDGSSDGTRRIVRDYSARDRRVRLVERAGPPSLAASLGEGVRCARGDIVVWMDADLSMPPSVAAALAAHVATHGGVAVGSRFVAGGRGKTATRGTKDSTVAALLSRLLNVCLGLMLGRSFKDYTSGFAAAPRELVLNLGLQGDYGEYFIGFVCRVRSRGHRIVEIPYEIRPRLRGESKTTAGIVRYLKRGAGYVAAGWRARTAA